MLINDKHYRPHLGSYHALSTVHLRNLNLKYLKRLDSGLAKNYSDYKMMGGSLKSFFGKIGKFGRKVLSSMPAISKALHSITGKALNFLTSDTGKAIVDKIGTAINSAIPGLGTVIKQGVPLLKKGYDGLTELINNIHNQNPGVSIDQATQLVKDIYNTSQNIYKDYKDDRQKAQDQKESEQKTAEQKALEQTKEITDKVNDIIKDEGKQEISAGLLKSAKYLPLFTLVNPVYTKKSKDGGMVKLDIPIFKKPTELIKKYVPNGPIAVKEYPTAAIKKYAGRLFLAGQCGTSATKNDSGRLYLGGLPNPLTKTEAPKPKGKTLLDKLRKNEL